MIDEEAARREQLPWRKLKGKMKTEELIED
jgi:hypothetical protein